MCKSRQRRHRPQHGRMWLSQCSRWRFDPDLPPLTSSTSSSARPPVGKMNLDSFMSEVWPAHQNANEARMKYTHTERMGCGPALAVRCATQRRKHEHEVRALQYSL